MTRTILFDETNAEWQIVDERGQVMGIYVLHCEAEAALAKTADMNYGLADLTRNVRERLERVFTDVDCVYMDLREGSTEANQIGDALNHLEQAIDILKKMEREP